MKVFLIEDERLGLDRLTKLLYEVDPQVEVLGHAESVKSAVGWIQNNPTPDLFFMDIELADGQCFDLFKQVEVKVPIIFTTAYDEYALHAFQVNSLDYLLKPIRREELERALKKYGWLKEQFGRATTATVDIDKLVISLKQAQQPKTFRQRFLVKQGQRLFSIEVNDIAWFMAEGKLCFLRTWENQRYLLDYSLEELAELLDPGSFFRASRNYILHIRAVRNVQPYFNSKLHVQIHPAAEPQHEVIVSKEKAGEFKKWLGK